MQATVSERDEERIGLSVELSPEEGAEEIERAAKLVAYKRGIKPEENRLPLEVVREQLGEEEAAAAIDREIMERLAPFVLAEQEIDIVGAPEFFSTGHATEGEAFAFAMAVVPVPAFELSSYEPVSIAVPPVAVTDDEVAEQVAALAGSAKEQATDDDHDVVRTGDVVELAMETTRDGERVRPLCAGSRTYETGKLAMPEGFDEAICGMRVGETKEFSFEGPSLEVDADGKPIMERFDATVTVKRIVKAVLPEVTDEWVSRVMPSCKTVGELEARIRTKLRAQKEAEHAKQSERLAANELAKRFEAKISDAVYEAAISEARRTLEAQLAEQKTTMKDFLASQGMEEQQLTMQLMMEVREQLTRQFALDAYARHLGLEVEDADLEAFFEAIAPGQAAAARKDFEDTGRMHAARGAALRLKANRALVEAAHVTDATGPSLNVSLS